MRVRIWVFVLNFCCALLAFGIFLLRKEQVEYLFMACFLLGILIYGIFFSNSVNTINPIQSLAITFTILASFFWMNSCEELRRLYYEENIVFWDQFVTIDEPKPHRFIFAYDNSGAYLLDSLKIKTSNHLFIDYCNAINNYANWSLKDKYLDKKRNYKNLLIAKLCYDLISVEANGHLNDSFRVFKIGNLSDDCDFCTAEWGNISQKKEVINVLNNFYFYDETDKTEEFTDLRGFYKNIIGNISDDDYLYTLFIYSDFMHDMNNSTTLAEDASDIRESQKTLSEKKNLIQNIFYFPIKKKRQLKDTLMLPDSGNDTRLFNMDALDGQVPYKVHILSKNLDFYPSKKSKYSVSLRGLKSQDGVRIFSKDNTRDLSIWDGKKRYYSKNEIINESIEMVWDKKPDLTPTPQLEITHKGVHYLVSCGFDDNLNQNKAHFIHFGFILIGILLGELMQRFLPKNKNS